MFNVGGLGLSKISSIFGGGKQSPQNAASVAMVVAG
jgi:hypothetical protein